MSTVSTGSPKLGKALCGFPIRKKHCTLLAGHAGQCASDARPQVPHYQQAMIEPIDYILAHGMSYAEGNVVKYITRWRRKGGIQDLLKAKDYLEFLIQDAGEHPARYGLRDQDS